MLRPYGPGSEGNLASNFENPEEAVKDQAMKDQPPKDQPMVEQAASQGPNGAALPEPAPKAEAPVRRSRSADRHERAEQKAAAQPPPEVESKPVEAKEPEPASSNGAPATPDSGAAPAG